MGGAAGGCFAKDTSVEILGGQKKIQEIKKGDLVLSYDKEKKSLCYNKVVETFINGGGVECIRVKTNGTEIKATANHKFLFNGEWIELGELAWRDLERDRQEWDILDKQQRKIEDKELEEFWKRNDNESGNKQKRILAYGYCFRRKEQGSENSYVSGRSIYTEDIGKEPDKPQGFQQKEQSDRKSGMGDPKGEFSSCNRKNERISGKCGQDIEFEDIQGRGECIKQTDESAGHRDKREIRSSQMREKAIGAGISCKAKHHKGYYSEKELEAFEINLDDIWEIEFYSSDECRYDFTVENTYNYIITKNKIIVHNSKSFTGCLWQIDRRLKYAGSRGFIARAQLKTLKESTLLTFFEVCKKLGLVQGKDFTYNIMTSVIKFSNGSEEYLKDLFLYPSDPDFVSLGSTEFTDGFIDEMPEITEQAYQIIRSRIRYKLDEFGLIPKIAMGSNPCKTFIYREFYKKWKDNQLEPYKAYIRASVYDNPFISEHYIENLKKLDPVNMERLLNGNWEYSDDPFKLFNYEKIIDMFTLDAERGLKYCIVDMAGLGRDKTVISFWDGFYISEIIMPPSSLTAKELDEMLTKRMIPSSNCLIDETGVGFGIVHELKNTYKREVRGFVAGSSPIKKEDEKEIDKVQHNFKNLRSQCWFTLANYVNSGMIGIYLNVPMETKKLIIEDLEQMKQKNADQDGKLQVITKEEIKEQGGLNRSTDCGDILMQRMFYTFEKKVPFAMAMVKYAK
jgi:hypothetical protein